MTTFPVYALTSNGNSAIRSAVFPVTQTALSVYPLALSDANSFVQTTNSAAATVFVPENGSVAFPVGTQIIVEQDGAGQVTFVAAVGVTLRKPATKALTIAEQYGAVLLFKVSLNVWIVSGYLTSP